MKIRGLALFAALLAAAPALLLVVDPRIFADCAHTQAQTILCPLTQTKCVQCPGTCSGCTETTAVMGAWGCTTNAAATKCVQNAAQLLCNNVWTCVVDPNNPQSCIKGAAAQPGNTFPYDTVSCNAS